MRCIVGFCVVLAVSVPVRAQNIVPGQEPFAQQSAVSTPVPNIHASGAGTLTTAQPGVPQNMVAGQPAATTITTVPAGNMTYYYYYPAANSGRMFRTTSPTTIYSANSGPLYTAPTQYYYTTARRGPFGLFRRRFVQPAYTTTAYTPTYSTSPGYYYYAPTTYVVPAPASTGMNTTGAVAPEYRRERKPSIRPRRIMCRLIRYRLTRQFHRGRPYQRARSPRRLQSIPGKRNRPSAGWSGDWPSGGSLTA